MEKNYIGSVANELNKRAAAFSIGNLPDIRSKITGRRRVARTIFDERTIFDTYAFHVGGRTELQFNIGLENVSGIKELRYGVAFSLKVGRNLKAIDPLLPKMNRFNEFILLEPDRYVDLRMWHWQKKRSSDSPPAPITDELVTAGTFIFLGQRQPTNAIDYDTILFTFDRLLPLYEYTESEPVARRTTIPRQVNFVFRPGCPLRSSWTTASLTQRQLDIKLRHNEIQVALHRRLVRRYGQQDVGVEIPVGAWAKIDVAVRRDNSLWIYEIKTASCARACIREALGQLLEYSLWPGAPKTTKLIVVGEAPLDNDAKAYLRRLNKCFPLPMSYEQVIIHR